MWKKYKQEKGFTITEILAAIAILGVVSVPLTSMLNRSATERLNLDKITAMNIAVEYIEQAVFNNRYVSGEDEKRINDLTYRVEREVKNREGKIRTFSVSVYRQDRILVKLKRDFISSGK